MDAYTLLAVLYVAVPGLGALAAMCAYLWFEERGAFEDRPRRMAERK